MKICFFLGGFYQNGGIGRVTSILANRFANEANVEVIALGYFDPHKDRIYNLSPKIQMDYFLSSYESMTKLLLEGREKKLRKYLTDNNVDVLIACGALFFPLSTRACRKIKTKCICWEHSNPEGNDDHRGQGLARRYGIKRSDVNVVLTKRALQIYKEKYGICNTVQIYNPIDPELLKRPKEYNFTSKKIISVGRLTYQKNFAAAVDVAKQILPKHPEWEWHIFGQGEELKMLVELTQKAGIAKQMKFKGQVMDLYDRYHDYSIMVMTSRYEGFPMTLLEGMGNGLPLVSFDIPTGPNEIIVEGENGFLIDPFDTTMMAEKIQNLIDSKELREQLAQDNLSKVSMFKEEEIVKAWMNLLKKLVQG